MSLDPLRNPKDPLHKAGPEAGRQLYKELSGVCHGFGGDAVIDAAINLIITVIRQAHPTWSSAEKSFDEKYGRAKTVLKDHYDSNGKRKNIFPFDQVIVMPRFKDPKKQ